MKKLLLCLLLIAPYLFAAEPTTPATAQGRYQVFVLPNGFYAFDTQTGELFHLQVDDRSKPQEWVRITPPISTALPR